jgi:hypothetical protein
MEFDLIGHLSPYTVNPTTFDNFESLLVESFPSSSSRHQIFEGYKRYVGQLTDILGSEFYQWVDGSFVTDKMNPNDIDVVTFVDADLFVKCEKKLLHLIAPESKLLYKVDAAFVGVYPLNHKLRMVTDWDIAFWKDFYGNTRPDTHKKQMPKGFIQLNF